MNEAVIRAKELHKHYKSGPKEVRAVNGVNLELNRGRSLAVVGPSGAGKSTLLHMIGGLDRPTRGEVLLNGKDVYKMGDAERARARNERIGFVFQFYHLLPEFTALENVMMPAMIKGTGYRVQGTGIKEKAEHLLKSIGLKDRLNHKPNELSGGESQRVAIARALINDPEILLCDEPTGNLDSKTSQSIYELLFGLKAAADMALIIVTHDESVSSRTDGSIRLKDGRSI